MCWKKLRPSDAQPDAAVAAPVGGLGLRQVIPQLGLGDVPQDRYVRIGGSRARIAAVLASEIVVVLLLGVALAGGLTFFVGRYGAAAIRALLLS